MIVQVIAYIIYRCKIISSQGNLLENRFATKIFIQNFLVESVFVAKSFPWKNVWKKEIFDKLLLVDNFLRLHNRFFENRFEKRNFIKQFFFWSKTFSVAKLFSPQFSSPEEQAFGFKERCK